MLARRLSTSIGGSLFPKRIALLEDRRGPFLRLRHLETLRDVTKLRQIRAAGPLILDHLQQQLHLIDIMHEPGLQRLVLFVLPEHIQDPLPRQHPTRNSPEQRLGDIFHDFGFPTRLLRLAHRIPRGDVADQRLRHVMDEGHFHAMREVELRG